MSIRSNLRDGSYEWLAAILLSWWIPFQLFGEFEVKYWMSLVLWGLPVALLLPRFMKETHRGSRRRQALLAATAYVVGAGVLLDFALGAIILDFSDCPPGKTYLLCLPALGGKVPIEEYLFYILGAMAIVLVYVWADMHWLAAYNVRKRQGLIPQPGHLVEVSPRVVLLGGVTLAIGIAWRFYYETLGPKELGNWREAIPVYYTFLVLLAFIPLMLIYRAVKDFVNWRAFSFTGLYVLLTAALWEVTLGLPGSWWFYKDDAMIGKFVPAWSTVRSYPIEAFLVWLAAMFVSVFLYEFWEAYYYDDRPPRVKLFTGRFPTTPPPPPPPPFAFGISVVVRNSDDLNSRLSPLRSVMRSGRLDQSQLEVIITSNTGVDVSDLPYARHLLVNDLEGWRSAGVRASRYATLCFVNESLTIAPSVLREIRDVLQSSRIVGGSTTAALQAPIAARIRRALADVPKAWLTGFDRGVVFCRRADFEALPSHATDGGHDELLRALKSLGKVTRRVLTRLTTDGVYERWTQV